MKQHIKRKKKEKKHKYRVCQICRKGKEEETIEKLIKVKVETTYKEKEKGKEKYIYIPVGTTIEEANKKITSNKKLEYIHNEKTLTENDIVKTGAIIQSEDKEKVYIIIVKGDINGDGKVDFINDIVRLNNSRLKKITLSTESKNIIFRYYIT